jgi:hypothetical protein
MAYTEDGHHLLVIVNAIEDSVLAAIHPERPIPSPKEFHVMWARIVT